MMLPLLAVSLLLAVASSQASGAAVPTKYSNSSNTTINWSACAQNVTQRPLLCGQLQVPLDYTDAKSGNLTLNLIKLTSNCSRGSILFNPGGPGIGGRNDLTGVLGSILPTMLSEEYDIITWDPRGSGNTLPFSCFATNEDRVSATADVPLTSNSSDTAAEQVWAGKKVLADACQKNRADYGTLVGTAFTARDMMQIVDALGEDGLLRYWGVSYGSLLGMTAAAMFPERVERVVVDGVLNPHDYYAGTDASQLIDFDATFAGFMTACMASPQLCPLAELGLHSVSLSQQIYGLLDRLKLDPVAVNINNSVTMLTYDVLKSGLFLTVKDPLDFLPAFSSLLYGLLTDNSTEVAIVTAAFYSAVTSTPAFPADSPEAQWGTQCSDAALRANELSDLEPLLETFYAQSVLGGDYLTVNQPLTCAQWPFRAKEIVNTTWNVTTRKPLLFVGNTFDPVTSLSSARNASIGFAGSAVLVQNGYGHASVAQPSRCTARYIRDYFVNGTLPSPDTICQVDVDLFTDESFVEGFATPEVQYAR